MTPQEYISGIQHFIDIASLDDVINNNLLANFNKKNPLPVGKSTSDPGYASGVANAYAEKAFGEAAPGTCEYGCRDLPLDQQAQCELACAGSCISTCNDTRKTSQVVCSQIYSDAINECNQLSSSVKIAACKTASVAKKVSCLNDVISTEALCVSDCTCFLIA